MKRADLATLVLLAATGILTALVYPRLPTEVATHFDFSGTPNGTMTRGVFAFFCPVLAIGLWVFHRLVVARGRGIFLQNATAEVGERMLLLQMVVVLGIHVLLLRNAVAPGRALVTSMVPLLLGGLSLAFALWLPRVRPNPYIGVRVPWTLGSRAVWAKTHRLAGYTYFGAFLTSLVSLFLPRAVASSLTVSVFIAASLVPVVYSFWISRTEGQDRHP